METFESLLPSGRAIRIERLFTKDYRDAQRRAGAKADRASAFNFSADLAHEILLSSLRAVTAEPVELKLSDAEDGTKDLDLDATLDAVPVGAWMTLNYEALVTKGATSVYEILKDVKDYEAAALFAQQVVAPSSPLDVMVRGKMRSRTA